MSLSTLHTNPLQAVAEDDMASLTSIQERVCTDHRFRILTLKSRRWVNVGSSYRRDIQDPTKLNRDETQA